MHRQRKFNKCLTIIDNNCYTQQQQILFLSIRTLEKLCLITTIIYREKIRTSFKISLPYCVVYVLKMCYVVYSFYMPLTELVY